MFSDDSSDRQIIRNFSFRQRLHLLFELLYGKLDERMRIEMKKLMLLSLRVQMYLLSSVEFLSFSGFSKRFSTVISPMSRVAPSPNFPVSSSYKDRNCLNIRTNLDVLDKTYLRK